jgi:hypothetical protein
VPLIGEFVNWELLETGCVGEFRACGARRTLGTCPVFAKPVDTNFARSRRFLEVPTCRAKDTSMKDG